MCMGFGCNACGVTGCRIIASPRERLVAILTNCFVPCNGRFPTLIALIGLTAMIYVWRQTGALLEPDHSQQELRRRRRLVNQTLYHLYEAETYGQMLVAGYASYENRYKRELRMVREGIDSLRMRTEE